MQCRLLLLSLGKITPDLSSSNDSVSVLHISCARGRRSGVAAVSGAVMGLRLLRCADTRCGRRNRACTRPLPLLLLVLVLVLVCCTVEERIECAVAVHKGVDEGEVVPYIIRHCVRPNNPCPLTACPFTAATV